MTERRFWVWAVAGGEWKPQHEFDDLKTAVAAAHELAKRGSVAIDAAGEWYTFPETGLEVLGPDTGPSPARRSGRFEVADLRHTPRVLLGGLLVKLANVSEDGIQIIVSSRQRLRVAEILELEFDDRATRVPMTCRVVWTKRRRVGLEMMWESTPAVSRSYLRRLARNAETAAARRASQRG